MRSLPVHGLRSGLALCALAAAPSLGSCAEPIEASETGRSHTFVTSKLGFVTHNEDGSIEGFDLDGAISTGHYTDGTGCGLADQSSSDGTPGIDNNLAPTLEAIIELTGDAVDGLVQQAINDGTLLVMLRLEGVDDLRNDPHVVVRLLKGSGRPQLATTNFIAPSQTFDVDDSTPESLGTGRIVDGHLEAGPFEAVIPLRFFGVSANMRLHDALFRGDIAEDGTLENGMMGGGIELTQILDLANQAGAMDHNAAIIAMSANAFLEPTVDLGFDGTACNQISAALRFEAEPAFLLGDEP